MTSDIADEDLYRFASRVHGQTIIITGGASGIGKAVAFDLAKRGAKLVIGDINTKASEELVNSVRLSGGTAIWKTCNVLDYEDQRSLFEYALEEFGSVDVVVANAGIGETERIIGGGVKLDGQGVPMKPHLKTIEVNFVSVIYTTQLAFHYLGKTSTEKSLQTLVLTASILSLATLRTAPLYCSSKHAVFSLSQSLRPEFEASGLRITTVHPWFVETPLILQATKDLLHGIPLSPMYRVVGAVVLAITDGASETNGAAYTIPDEREVFRILPAEINEDVYALLSTRAKRRRKLFQGVLTWYAIARYYAGTRFKKTALYAVIGYSLWTLVPKLLSYKKPSSS